MKKILAALITLTIATSLSAQAPQWSIDSETSGWNDDTITETYFHTSELQRQWAWELLGTYRFKGDETVLDFGCGDGKISAEISRLVKQGCVTGIDISSSMLRIAKLKFPPYVYPNLQFYRSQSVDFSDFNQTQGTYEVITSFCVFHVIPNASEVLKNLRKQIKERGTLLLTIPAGKNSIFFQAAQEVLQQYNLPLPWKSRQPSTAPSMRTLDGCKSLLNQAGFHVESIEMVDTDNPFYSEKELIMWLVGTTSANWGIPPQLARDFFTDLVSKMMGMDPLMKDEEGRIRFKLSRIHVVAKAN